MIDTAGYCLAGIGRGTRPERLPCLGEIMKNRIWLVALLAVAVVSAGCNTVAGAGKDIERGGESIQKAAE